ncbi:MAG: hypothetical protein Q9160_002425 [Pyrenula sp. 1 TL-2023]
MRSYEYEPLEADEIRLFELHAGDDGTELRGAIHVYRLPENEKGQHGPKIVLTHAGGAVSQNTPRFQALSYTWGSDIRQPPLLNILTDEALYQLPLKPNLNGALRRLRGDIPPGQSRMYWIDALCINQQNISEKNFQVQKMAMIYNRAESVAVWLGEEDEYSIRAMGFIEKLLDLNSFDPLTQDPGTDEEWAALMDLMQRSWFNRRWIVQEIALARDATIYCGTQSISWQNFSCAVALFASRHQDLRVLFQGSKKFQYHPNFLGEVDALGAKALVDITTNLFRKSGDGKVLERLLSMEALITTLTAFEASLPHDTIYAVLWLAHDAEPGIKENAAMSRKAVVQTPQQSPTLDPSTSLEENTTPTELDDHDSFSMEGMMSTSAIPGLEILGSSSTFTETLPYRAEQSASLRIPETSIQSVSGRRATDNNLHIAEDRFEDEPEPIVVDYKKEFYEVCKQFIEFAITQSRSLDILVHPWAPDPPEGEPELPSWISRLSSAPFEKKPGRNSYGRVSADPLVGRPGNGPRNYNASGKTKIYPSRMFIRGRTLITTGFVLDTVGVKKSPAFEGIIPSTWLDLVDWHGGTSQVPDEFWRTLVADRGAGGQKQPPAYFPLACKWVFDQRSKRGGINTTELLTFGKCPSIATEFIRRVQSVVWARRLIRSEGRRGSSRLLGLVPAEAETGDLICIIYGCSVPVLLRRRNKRTRSRPGNGSDSLYSPFDGIASATSTASSLVTSESEDNRIRSSANPRAQAEAINETVSLTHTPTSSRPPAGLSVPAQPPSTAFASHNVRRALRRDSEGRKVPELSISLESDQQYTFVGECYVHGMMAGEGFKHMAEVENKLRVFHLV